MKTARKASAVLIAIVCVAALGLRYLRYEQRVEIGRYQLGYTQGLELGALQQREDYKKRTTCYSFSDPEPGSSVATGIAVCGIAVLFDNDGHSYPVVDEDGHWHQEREP
jgi:hypothetical protein